MDETTAPIAPEPTEKIEEEEEKPKIEDFANDSDFIDALIDNKIQENREKEAEDGGTDFGTVNLSDLSFNGYNLLESEEKIPCIIGGKDVVIEITFMQYEIMCK